VGKNNYFYKYNCNKVAINWGNFTPIPQDREKIREKFTPIYEDWEKIRENILLQ